MAFTSTIDTDVGVPSLYQRITRVEYFAGDTNWVLTVEFYASEQARCDGKRPLYEKRFSVPAYRLEPNPLQSFYAALAGFDGTELAGAQGDESPESPLFVVNDSTLPGPRESPHPEIVPVPE